MNDIEENLEYILKKVKEGRKMAYCVVLLPDKKYNECERLYGLSHEMPASHILGEIEMWKLDVVENMVSSENEINGYMHLQKDREIND